MSLKLVSIDHLKAYMSELITFFYNLYYLCHGFIDGRI